MLKHKILIKLFVLICVLVCCVCDDIVQGEVVLVCCVCGDIVQGEVVVVLVCW